MVFDNKAARMGGREHLSPMEIAHHTLFTAKEKIALLHELKAEVTGAAENVHDLGITAEEIDEAIAEVREGAQRGVGSETVLRGDF